MSDYQYTDKELCEYAAQVSARSREVLYLRDRLRTIAERAYPIFTSRHPNPENGKMDCRLERLRKEGLRQMLLKRLEERLENESIEQIEKCYE